MKTVSEIARRMLDSFEMSDALALDVPNVWPEGKRYLQAEQVAAIAAVLIDTVHRHLEPFDIVYLFRETITKAGHTVLGQASIVPAKWRFVAGPDFSMDINHEQWLHAEPEDKVALVDHELCHFGIEETDDEDKLVLIPHDIEEFNDIVRRWGQWKPDVRKFAETCRATQFEFDLRAHSDGMTTTVSVNGGPEVPVDLDKVRDRLDDMEHERNKNNPSR